MKINLLLVACILYSITPKATASVNINLFQCTLGSFLSNCKVVENKIIEPHELEKEHKVSYILPCQGPAPTFELTQDKGTPVKLEYTNSEKTVASVGYGNLKIIDTNPRRTASRPWPKGCELKVTKVESSFSTGTIEKWKAERINTQYILDEKNKLLDAYEYLALLQPGYEVTKVVADLILQDLDVAADLAKFLKYFQECKIDEEGNTVDCQLFMKLIGDNSDRLSFQEKIYLSKLNSILLQVDPETPESIKGYMSESDLKILAEIAEKSKEFEDLDVKIENLSREIATLDIEIMNLNKLIGD
ncbi:MAG: hypothetical protein ACOH5I_24500 [Oligoflexus sp.]